MHNIKIKICGINIKEDALLAEKLGAWAVGFIFVENTPRYITPKNAAEIINSLDENFVKIGVFANISIEKIQEISEQTGLTKIQLHGDESPDFCKKLADLTGKEIIKALRIRNEEDLQIIDSYRQSVSYILLDSFSEKHLGGTGKIFDWKIAQKAKEKDIPIILAGGLSPDNARQAYETVQPYALDISSGVEADKGIKDHKKLEKLFSTVNLQ